MCVCECVYEHTHVCLAHLEGRCGGSRNEWRGGSQRENLQDYFNIKDDCEVSGLDSDVKVKHHSFPTLLFLQIPVLFQKNSLEPFHLSKVFPG